MLERDVLLIYDIYDIYICSQMFPIKKGMGSGVVGLGSLGSLVVTPEHPGTFGSLKGEPQTGATRNHQAEPTRVLQVPGLGGLNNGRV